MVIVMIRPTVIVVSGRVVVMAPTWGTPLIHIVETLVLGSVDAEVGCIHMRK
jgi:hypothetical protein